MSFVVKSIISCSALRAAYNSEAGAYVRFASNSDWGVSSAAASALVSSPVTCSKRASVTLTVWTG
jgi:hypothetical protein